jgi:hypothetical protein
MKSLSGFLQFIFPILAILCLTTSLFGSYTIQFSLGFLLIGFLFSIYLIISKKLFLWGTINLILTVFIIIGGIIIFFSMIISGV